jgi:hypothetical protein
LCALNLSNTIDLIEKVLRLKVSATQDGLNIKGLFAMKICQQTFKNTLSDAQSKMKPDISQLANISAVTNSPFKESNSIPTKISKDSSKGTVNYWDTRPLNMNSNEKSNSNTFITANYANAVEDKVKLYPSSDSSETLTEVSKKDQMLDILRNFDSKTKKEQVLYSSKSVVVKSMNTPKKWIVTPKQSGYPVNSTTTKNVINTGGGSIAEKLKMFNNAKEQEETPRTEIQRQSDRKIISATSSQYPKLESIIEEDIPEQTKLSRSKSFSDRLKRFQKDPTPCVPVSSSALGSSKSKNHWHGAKQERSEVLAKINQTWIKEEDQEVAPKMKKYSEIVEPKESKPVDTMTDTSFDNSNEKLDVIIN